MIPLTTIARLHSIEPSLSISQIEAIIALVCDGAEALCPLVTGKVKPFCRKAPTTFQPRTDGGLTAAQVAKAYNFPVVNVSKRTIAIVELGGQYPVTTGVKVVEIDGAAESSSDADGEVALDVQVIQGAAPGVKIVLIFAPNTEQGFADAVAKAIALDVDAISISWGAPEDQWTQAGREALDAQFKIADERGIGIYCAAGDSGSSDGELGNHVDYPASSPWVVACGGTKLELTPDGLRSAEVAWSPGLLGQDGSTGGGISAVYPGRKLPDVSGNADPNTGYLITVDGQEQQVGGTSAVAPLYAALQALLNASIDAHVGHLPARFYQADRIDSTVFFDVTEGNNGGYKAGPGYDEVTGLGVVDGQKFLAFLEKPE